MATRHIQDRCGAFDQNCNNYRKIVSLNKNQRKFYANKKYDFLFSNSFQSITRL
mgnify:CR=1 FL=1